MEITCHYCGKTVEKDTGHVNRARKNGNNIYCSKKCSGYGRRISKAEKVEKKRLYDIKYRRKNASKIKRRREKYYSENKEEIYARQRESRDNDEARKKHAEYCRRPDQRKKERKNRYKRRFGENWDDKKKLCVACQKEKFILEFEHSPIFPDNRRHICNDCEDFQKKEYGYSTRLTLAAMKSRRYTNLMWEDFAKHPYLIEANKFLILLKRELL